MDIFYFQLQLSEDLGFPVRPKKDLTFQKCLEMKLQDHVATIAKVAEVAGKEYSIEQVCAYSEDFSDGLMLIGN